MPHSLQVARFKFDVLLDHTRSVRWNRSRRRKSTLDTHIYGEWNDRQNSEPETVMIRRRARAS